MGLQGTEFAVCGSPLRQERPEGSFDTIALSSSHFVPKY